MNSFKPAIAMLLLLLLATTAAWGQAAVAEARGAVEDEDGNPIVGATIRFRPQGNPEQVYDGKTNKKGRYYIPGMFNPSEEGMWFVEVEAEGYLPVKMTVETRNAQRVLMGDVRTHQIKAQAKLPEVMIRAFGLGQVDLVMAPEAEVLASAQAAATATATAEAGPAAAAPKVDPWDSALDRVSSGDLAGSLEFFDKAIEEQPDSAERAEAYAKVLYQMKRYDEAEVQALRAKELAPGDVDVLMVLYSIHVGAGDLAAAEEVLVEAGQASPDDPRILRQLAYVAGESGNAQAAIEANLRLTEIDPADADAWLSLADLYASTGQMEQSAAAYEQVIALDPGGAPQVFFNLGALLMNKPDRTDADTERAVTAFRKAIELKPDYREAHKQLAFALLGTGDRAGAKSQLEAYVALAPNAPDSAQMKALIQSLQ
ncbi:MAG TPA: tetratricopeptide repeat protein [Candidatus Polarisedimenticolaceae bacterium]|nr:tetratricopeptide repeat protein [Candidatus Polarisedimenticolaceae bacterium]